jgi:hypothetical protein
MNPSEGGRLRSRIRWVVSAMAVIGVAAGISTLGLAGAMPSGEATQVYSHSYDETFQDALETIHSMGLRLAEQDSARGTISGDGSYKPGANTLTFKIAFDISVEAVGTAQTRVTITTKGKSFMSGHAAGLFKDDFLSELRKTLGSHTSAMAGAPPAAEGAVHEDTDKNGKYSQVYSRTFDTVFQTCQDALGDMRMSVERADKDTGMIAGKGKYIEAGAYITVHFEVAVEKLSAKPETRVNVAAKTDKFNLGLGTGYLRNFKNEFLKRVECALGPCTNPKRFMKGDVLRAPEKKTPPN